MPKIHKLPYLTVSIIVMVFLVLCYMHNRPAPKYINWSSFEIADILVEKGQFTNGGKTHNSVSGYAFAPAYPVLIASIAWLAPSGGDELHCIALQRRQCNQTTLANIIILVQVFAGLLALVFVYLLSTELSFSLEISVLTVLLFMFSSGLAKFSQSLMPFNFVTLLILAASYYAVLSYRRHSNPFALFSGISFALAALFYPPFLGVPLLTSLALFFAIRTSLGARFSSALALLTGVLLVLAPWIVRNYFLFGDLALTHNSSINLLAIRVAYNSVSFSEKITSIIFSIPNFGDSLARVFFPLDVFDKLGHGKGALLNDFPKIVAATRIQGTNVGQYGEIVSRYIIGDFYRYISVIPTLFLRGLWGGSTLGLFGVFFLWPLLKRLKYTNNASAFLIALAALAGGVLMQTLIAGTHNPHHFNTQILFIHAYAIAHVIGGLELPRALRTTSKINNKDFSQ